MARDSSPRRRPVVEEIEPRILYSADLSPALLDAGPPVAASEVRVVDPAGEFQETAAAQQIRRHELVFVDTATPDYQAIVDDIAVHSTEERHFEVVLIESGSDGIAAIGSKLGATHDVSAVHIIGHGGDGTIALGAARLDFDSLLGNATQIKHWGDALTADADLLLYGCNVAQSAAGRSLMEALARLTGADVAASDDPTGAPSRGGDWDLEVRTGPIEAASALSAGAQTSWYGLLDGQSAAPDAPPAQDASPQQSVPASAVLEPSIASIPLAFERNAGQVDAQFDFVARGNGYAVALDDADALIVLSDGATSYALRLDVAGANAGREGMGESLLQAKSNYLSGSPDQWLTDIANYGAVRYDDVYDGIDLRYYGNQRQLEYDFLVDAGADVSAIALHFDGAHAVSIADSGDLTIALDADGHSVSFKAPVAYQNGPDGREAVASRYVLRADGTVGFEVGSYDTERQLVIDPVLSYGTYYGSTGADVANGLAVDAAGNVYVTGYTPSGTGLLGGLLGGGNGDEVFVAKFSPTLNAAVYSAFVGGKGDDYGTSLAVDAAGNAYVTGYTKSTDFPTVSAFQSSRDGGQDAFVFKLNAAGSGLTYSTYLGGGGGSDVGWAIAVDAAGSAYVAGVASSSDFPTTAGAADTSYAGGEAFVTKLGAAGNTLVYSSFIGGNGADIGYGIAVEAAGNAVVVGATASSSGMPLAGAFQVAYGGGTDAFVARLNSAGTAFTYGSYLGGSGSDIAYNLALDGAGKIYVTGETKSANFATPGALQTVLGSGTDAFLTIVDPSASGSASRVYSTYLGGSKNAEAGLGVGVDAGGRVYVGGQTDSDDFAVTAGAHKTTNSEKPDAFFVILNPLANGAGDLVYGTYYGGTNDDDHANIALYSNGKFYLAGDTVSSSGIATAGRYDTSYSSNTDAFVAVFTIPPTVATSAGSLAYAENAGALVLDAGAAVSDPGIASLAGATLRITANYANGEDVLAFNNVNPWGIAGTWNAATGTLALVGSSSVANYQAALRSVTYQNTSDKPSTAARTVSVTVSDGALSSASAARQIAVTAVNDSPVNAVPGAQATNEDTPLVFSTGNGNAIAVSDVDASTGAVQVSLNVTNGRLTLAQTTGLTFVTGNGSGNAVMTFTGTIANVNAALDGLRFDPNANFNGSATLQLVINDQGNSGSGGPLSASNNVTIAVAAVNDAPVNNLPGPQSTALDTALVFSTASGNAVSVSDIDAASGTLTVNLVASNGTVALGSLAGVTHSGNGTGAVTLSGTLAALNNALNGMTFTPVSGYSGPAGLGIVTDDGGNTGGGGALIASDALSITVSPNVPPTVTTSGSTLNYTENAPPAAIDPGLVAADPDTALLDHAVVRIAVNYVAGEDVLGFTDQLGIAGSWNAATGTLTLSGAASAADYQAALRSVTYWNAGDDPSQASRTVTFVLNDGVANGAIASSAVIVWAVNDGPAITAPLAQTMAEDSSLMFSVAGGNEVRIADPDHEGNALRVTLASTNGTLMLAQTSGLTFLGGADGSSALDVVGTLDDINAALNGLRFEAAADFHGSADLQITVDDQGNVGAGGAAGDAANVSITVDPVNDAPAGSGTTIGLAEDATVVLGIADFGFSDSIDVPADSLLAVRINTVPTAGKLTLNGIDVAAGQFVMASDIAGGMLAFTPAADANGAGYASFTFQVQDDGGILNGGVDLDPTPRTMTFDVSAVNDAPVANLPAAQATVEDVPLIFSIAGGNAILIDDVDALGAPMLVTLSANNGTLTLAGTAGLTLATGTGTGDPIVSFSGSQAAINAALDGMRFTPAASYVGAASVGILVDDLGNSGAGGPLGASGSVAVTVTPVNHAPAGADRTVATLEDSAYVFAAADFGFTDPSDAPPHLLSAVMIASLPGAGTLVDDGVAVSAGQFVALADISAGKLQFLPSADSNGTAYASFTFQVQDDGGTAGGGADLDPTPNTITIDVTAVNDAPAGADNIITLLEDAEYTFAAADFGFTDASDSPADALAAVRIASLSGAGSLTLSGSAVAAGQSISAADVIGGNFKFTPAANGNGAGYASFTFRVQDSGGSASGGVDLDPSANTMTVDVVAVNDAPAGADNTITTLEDAGYTFAAVDFGFTDAADSPADTLSTVRIATVPGAATLTLSGTAVTPGQTISIADIAAGNLAFAPAADANGVGYAGFTFQVQDQGGTANGGVDLDPSANTMTVNVTAVNDAPVIAINAGVTLGSGAGTQIGDTLLLAADPDNTPAQLIYTVIALPGSGSLTLNGTALAPLGTFTQSDVASGLLGYVHGGAASGGDSFSFVLSDGAGGSTGTIDFLLTVSAPTPPAVTPPPVTTPPVIVPPAPPPVVPSPPVVSGPPISTAPVVPAPAPFTPGASGSDSSADGSASAPSGASASSEEESEESALAAAMLESEAAARPRGTSVQGTTGFSGYGGRGGTGVFLRKVGFESFGPVQTFSETGLLSGAGLLGEMSVPGIDVGFQQASPPPGLEAYRAALSNSEWVKELDQMRDTVNGQAKAEHKLVASTVAVTGAMSVGYVIWLLRGGLLLSSLLSSLPAWHVIDPMPVLARSNRDDEDVPEDDDPLEKLFGRAKAAIGLGSQRADPTPAAKPVLATTEAVEA